MIISNIGSDSLPKTYYTVHPKNSKLFPYHFDELFTEFPNLVRFRHINKNGLVSLDFAHPEAGRELNKSLFKKIYHLDFWDIPPGFLTPPLPGRADYIHYLNDFLGESPPNELSYFADIGTGAGCIYALLGFLEYGWHFTASDIDEIALENARKILLNHQMMSSNIELVHQNDKNAFFKNVLKPNIHYKATLCNPPFFDFSEDALKKGNRKWKKAGVGRYKEGELNFGGGTNELYYQGGEVQFIKNMMRESLDYRNQVDWFSSLVSKKAHLPELHSFLEKLECTNVQTVEMRQGQKESRFIAWKMRD